MSEAAHAHVLAVAGELTSHSTPEDQPAVKRSHSIVAYAQNLRGCSCMPGGRVSSEKHLGGHVQTTLIIRVAISNPMVTKTFVVQKLEETPHLPHNDETIEMWLRVMVCLDSILSTCTE